MVPYYATVSRINKLDQIFIPLMVRNTEKIRNHEFFKHGAKQITLQSLNNMKNEIYIFKLEISYIHGSES